MTSTEPSDVVRQASSLSTEAESQPDSALEETNLDEHVGQAESLSSDQDSDSQLPGVQASTNSATLLEQMDKEQDQVLLQLDQLNSEIESLIQEYAQTRLADGSETGEFTPDAGASEETPDQSLKAA